MTASQNQNGLALAERYYRDYGARAKELKQNGRKVIGYLSALGPVEILTAAGVVPLRLKGDVSEAITKGDAFMETIICPFVRNVFDGALRGRYAFIDGMVLPHQCDSIDRTNDVWSYNLKLPYWHYLNVPHLTDEPSMEFMKEILRLFTGTLEKFTGAKIADETLARAVKAHNENRQTMRELYELMKSSPPLVSGHEMMTVLVAAMGLPVEESTALIKAVTNEVKQRSVPADGKKRIMLVGDQIDDVAIVDAIESAGAWLVTDDLSIGGKIYWSDVEATTDPMEGIAERYLKKLKLPTTFIDSGNTYGENLEARFGQVRNRAKEFGVDGVILLVYKYCDPYGFEVPAIKSFIEAEGIPVLYLEDEYSTSTLARMKTRIEAFLEMIE
jgi:bzd-type benzoyl-CoA reductase N subunit